jgi:phage regulator Rha-like protein
MNSLEIAELVESRHDTVKRAIERLAERGTIQLPPMAEVENPQSRSNNNKVEVYIFDLEHKRDSFVVVAQLSPEFTAKLVDRWQALETGEATPAYMSEQAKPKRANAQLAAKMVIARAAKSMLRMSETSTIRMLSDIAKSEGIEPTFLPAYVNESLTKALTNLLKDLNHPLASKVRSVVHPALEQMGILEHLSRPSSSKAGEVRYFWSLTDEGLKYGRNETSPNNPRETIPLYFVDRFSELLALVEAHVDSHPKKANGRGGELEMH